MTNLCPLKQKTDFNSCKNKIIQLTVTSYNSAAFITDFNCMKLHCD